MSIYDTVSRLYFKMNSKIITDGKRRINMEEYITMYDEIMSQEWVIQGPLLELDVLSLVTKPINWNDKENISNTEVLENRNQFLIGIITKMEEIKPTVEIVEDYERIYNEIKLLNEDKLVNAGLSYFFRDKQIRTKTRRMEMRIFINIGYKRKGRMSLEKVNDDIIKISIMYVDDDYRFKYTRELKKLLNKMIELFNGICGSIGHENTISSIINVDQLLSDKNFRSFYVVKWNNKV